MPSPWRHSSEMLLALNIMQQILGAKFTQLSEKQIVINFVNKAFCTRARTRVLFAML